MTADAPNAIRDQHASLAAVLRSISMMIDTGPGDEPERFFDVLRAMLFYIDEFPEKLHHKRESENLFPRVRAAVPELADVIDALEAEHHLGESRVRELQHLLLAWELLGDSKRGAFEEAARGYVRFYLEHMRVEETQVLPAARRIMSPQEWAELDEQFRIDPDPFTSLRNPAYDRLFARIVLIAPAPIGVGPALGSHANRAA